MILIVAEDLVGVVTVEDRHTRGVHCYREWVVEGEGRLFCNGDRTDVAHDHVFLSRPDVHTALGRDLPASTIHYAVIYIYNYYESTCLSLQFSSRLSLHTVADNF